MASCFFMVVIVICVVVSIVIVICVVFGVVVFAICGVVVGL